MITIVRMVSSIARLTDRDALHGSVPCVAWAIEAQTPSRAPRRFAGRGPRPIPRLGSDRRSGYRRSDAMEASMRPARSPSALGRPRTDPSDIDVAMIHKNFTLVVLMQLAAKGAAYRVSLSRGATGTGMCDSYCAAGAFDARMRWGKARIKQAVPQLAQAVTPGSSTWSRRLEIHVYDIPTVPGISCNRA
jgi:hypothetical protein